MTATVVIPVPPDADEAMVARARGFRPGTPILIVESDEGWAAAVNDGVKAAGTEFVLVSDHRAFWDKGALEMLASVGWDCDVVYPGAIYRGDDDRPVFYREATAFCPHRLQVENYLPELALVRRDAFLAAGGLTSGAWELWRRMAARGARLKACPEALYTRSGLYEDSSPAPADSEFQASFYYQATAGTAYWRCLLPARHLPGQAVFNIPGIRVRGEDAHDVLEAPTHRGTAVFQYAGDIGHAALTRFLQKDGHRVLVEVDDDYTHWGHHVERAGWSETVAKAKPGGYSVQGHVETVGMADGVIATTEFLAKRYRKHNPVVHVCPNQIDPADWPALEKPDDGVFRVGWFGSGSHVHDAPLLKQAVEWAAGRPNVEVVLIGVGVSHGKPWYGCRFKHVPWSPDLGVYRRFLLELDVCFAPVVGTPWAQGRSDLKALEALMAGACPVLSNQPPYTDWVDGEFCRKATSARDFLRVTQELVNDPAQARELARAGREYVLEHRTVQANIDLWRAAVAA